MSYKCTVIMPNGIVKVEEKTVEISVRSGQALTLDELAAIAAITETIRMLRSGKFVHYEFNPTNLADENKLVKCEWLRSGNLKIHGNTDKLYRYVETYEEAMLEQRTFTCRRSLLAKLPLTKKGK